MAEQMPLTAEELAAIQARVEAATPGPWDAVVGTASIYPVYAVGSTHGGVARLISSEYNVPDVEFIANSRQDVPRLLAMVAEYQAALECIVSRYEREHHGEGFPRRGGQLAWAMHSDAESALRGKFRQPD